MQCRIADLRAKEVINIRTGTRLGMVCDVLVDTVTASVLSIVIYGKWRLFGLLGREEDLLIPWNQIKTIGKDAILVEHGEPHSRRRKKAGLFHRAFGSVFE